MTAVIESYRLTPLQEGLLASSLAEPAAGFGCPQVIGRFDVDIDVEAMESAWSDAVRRHPILRTRCAVRDGQLWHDVLAASDVRMARPGLLGEAGLADFLVADRSRGFDLSAEAPSRVTWVAAEHGGALVWTIHHIAMDADTAALVLIDVLNRYDAIVAGSDIVAGRDPAAEPVRESFSRHARWSAGQGAPGDAAFWAAYLEGAPSAPPPASGSRAAGRAPSATAAWRMDEDLRCLLVAAASRHGVTLATMFHGAWALVMERTGHGDDIIIGAVLSTWEPGRPRTAAGPAITMLPLRVRVLDDVPVGAWLREVRASAASRRPHLHTPTEQAMSTVDAVSRSAPFATLVNWQPDPWADQIRRAGCGPAAASWELRDRSVFPLVLDVYAGDRLTVRLEGHADRYDTGTLDRILTRLQQALLGLLDDGPVRRVSILAAGERDATVAAWAASGSMPLPAGAVHTLIGAGVARDTPAVGAGTETLTYGALADESDRLAWFLRGAGIGPGTIAGVCLSRGTPMVVAILAVLKAGGAFLPLDPAYPSARLEFMALDAGAALVVTERAAVDLLPASLRPVVLDGEDRPAIATAVPVPLPQVSRRDLAYVIYTSGSTGQPKGVAVEHGALLNLAVAQRAAFGVTVHDRVLQFAAFSFDAAVSEITVTLLAGAYLQIATEDERIGPALHDRLRDSRITSVTLPPSAVTTLSWAPGALPDLRTVVSAGEAIPPGVLSPWAADRRVINAYGPTENTVCVSVAEFRPGSTPLIGRPLANLRVYVLDRRLDPVPPGVRGELYVGGAGVARGYVGRPGLTATRFIADRFGADGGRLYRTGDLVRWSDGGELEFLGRTDDQVKVRSFRIELGEVETAVRAHPDVDNCVAVVRSFGDDASLIAYVDARAPADAALRAWLGARLPAHLIPDVFVPIAAFPTTRAGKIDRAALPVPDVVSRGTPRPYAAPRTDLEVGVATIWAEILRVDRVGRQDTFAELGGNSLRAVRAAARIQAALGMRSPVGDILNGLTVADIAQRLQPDGAVPTPIPRRRRRGDSPAVTR